MTNRNRPPTVAALLLALTIALPTPSDAQGITRYGISGWEVAAGLPSVAGALFAGQRLTSGVRGLDLAELQGLDRSSVNGIDRYATYQASQGWKKASDVLLIASLATAVVAVTPKATEGHWEGAMMALEVGALAHLLTSVAKVGAQRIRPYAYNDALAHQERLGDGGNVRFSFFSGHAAGAFAAAVFASTYVEKSYPASGTAHRVIWVSTIAAATGTMIGRVQAGKHYPSDVLIGAVVGSLIGWAVPRLHEEDLDSIPGVSPQLSRAVNFGFRIGVGPG